jgi:mitochondrial fission protein ELM1
MNKKKTTYSLLNTSPIYKFIVITWTLKQVSEIAQSLQKLTTEYKQVNKSPWLMPFQTQIHKTNFRKKKKKKLKTTPSAITHSGRSKKFLHNIIPAIEISLIC